MKFNDKLYVKQEENMTAVKTEAKQRVESRSAPPVCYCQPASVARRRQEQLQTTSAQKQEFRNKVRQGGKLTDRMRKMFKNNRICNSTQNIAEKNV